jgi:hypothetical protein
VLRARVRGGRRPPAAVRTLRPAPERVAPPPCRAP